MLSCGTIRPTQTVISDREIARALIKTDSVYVHDSIYLRERNDTVYLTRWKTVYRDHYIGNTDTCYVDRRETVIKVVKERYMPWYWRPVIAVGFAAIFWLLLRLILWIMKKSML